MNNVIDRKSRMYFNECNYRSERRSRLSISLGCSLNISLAEFSPNFHRDRNFIWSSELRVILLQIPVYGSLICRRPDRAQIRLNFVFLRATVDRIPLT